MRTNPGGAATGASGSSGEPDSPRAGSASIPISAGAGPNRRSHSASPASDRSGGGGTHESWLEAAGSATADGSTTRGEDEPLGSGLGGSITGAVASRSRHLAMDRARVGSAGSRTSSRAAPPETKTIFGEPPGVYKLALIGPVDRVEPPLRPVAPSRWRLMRVVILLVAG